ncbi:MAG: insulinase family protein [Bacteroidetes bacterium]|nr:MAG: insulinase family protein [Bacteroidota bacterium]
MLNRKIAPKITDAVEFHLALPPYTKYTLKNGVEVYSIDLGTQETLMINWVFFAGNWYEEKNLVAAATNFLLKNGTSGKNAFQINEHFEYYGAFLNRSAQHETAEITLHCLSKHVHELLPVVSELITDSILPEGELEIFKKNMQQRLQVNLKKNDFVAARLIDSYLFGADHPYGRCSSLEDYENLQRDELLPFYRKYYQTGRCMIFVAGKIPDGLIPALETHFGSLALRSAHDNSDNIKHPLEATEQKKYSILNDPNGVQGAIRIARSFPNRHHPDFQKFQVLNNIFGGYFGSRLMTNIREDKGYTYGIHSYLLNQIQQSAFMISTEAGKEVCEATIREVHNEMNSLREKPVRDEELQTTRNFMIGTLLGDLDGPFQVAGRWKTILLNNLDAEYFYKGIEIIKSITPMELQELANKYFDVNDYYELVVI